jgi:hypothetical protein
VTRTTGRRVARRRAEPTGAACARSAARSSRR